MLYIAKSIPYCLCYNDWYSRSSYIARAIPVIWLLGLETGVLRVACTKRAALG